MGSAWEACRTFTFPDKHKNSSLHLLLEMLRANVCSASSRKKLSARRSFLSVAHVLPRSAAKQATACPYWPSMVKDKSSSSKWALAPTPSTNRWAATPVKGIPLTSKVRSGKRFAAVIPARVFMVSKPISRLLASTSLVIDAATWDSSRSQRKVRSAESRTKLLPKFNSYTQLPLECNSLIAGVSASKSPSVNLADRSMDSGPSPTVSKNSGEVANTPSSRQRL
mmetsp:Transcript_119525/g.273935  ORF Transcript_119525/g.273935 Transcript_119525/m.273935 type:complete len:224 (-) Transcript_119525:1940-2611(-)